MSTIKLTDETWLNHESDRVRGRLLVVLGGSEGKPGIDTAQLVRVLKKGGLVYEGADLLLIKNRLIADGVIEEIA